MPHGKKSQQLLNFSAQDALFFDLDGTLLELASCPDKVIIPPDLPVLFNKLAASRDGAVAVITGRDMDFVDKIFGGANIAASASHGAVIRQTPGGPVKELVPRPDLTLLIDLIRKKRPLGIPASVRAEHKDFACAIHFRNAVSNKSGKQAQKVGRLVQQWANAICKAYNGNLPASKALSVTEGDLVFELGPASVDKGTVLEMFMDVAPFKSRRPVFFGDSLADKPAMDAARRTRNGAAGLAVAVGKKLAPCADITVNSPSALRHLLSQQP